MIVSFPIGSLSTVHAPMCFRASRTLGVLYLHTSHCHSTFFIESYPFLVLTPVNNYSRAAVVPRTQNKHILLLQVKLRLSFLAIDEPPLSLPDMLQDRHRI